VLGDVCHVDHRLAAHVVSNERLGKLNQWDC
jgi:hypothetical protein